MHARKSLLWTSVLVLCLAAVLPLQGAFAQDEPAAGRDHFLYLPDLRGVQQQEVFSPALVTAIVTGEEQEQTAAFWTRERMAAATLLDVLVVEREPVGAGGRDSARPGPRGASAGSLPDPNAQAQAQVLYASEWARMATDQAVLESSSPLMGGAGAEQIDAYASVPPFTSYYVNDSASTWKSFPWITMGRLFFRIPGLAGEYACTGAVAYGRAVWTAGHCVYTTGRGWSYNMYFVPAYRNAAYPYGSFTVKSRTALNEWVTNANLAYDIGMVAVNDKSGMKLSQWVGSVGFMYNQPATQLFHSFGYASNYSNGQYLVTCATTTYTRDPLVGPDPIGVGCDMSSGSSGGPWLVGYAPFKGGLTNYINSVVSYHYASKPLEIYGPYFGDEAKLLYDWGKTQ